MKKIFSAALALAMTLSLLPAAFAAGGTAYASTQAVEVDGKKVEFQMYALKDAAGNPTNYVKLRDVAHVLNGTKAQFSVGYDGSISVTTGQPYADAGGEMTTPYFGDRAYRAGSGAVKVNGQSASLESIILTDDAGGDYTYFKLRDLGSALGFKVDWDAERGVIVETGGSTAPQETPPVETELTISDIAGTWINWTGTRFKFGSDSAEMISDSGWHYFGMPFIKKENYTIQGSVYPYTLEMHWTSYTKPDGKTEPYDETGIIHIKSVDLENGRIVTSGIFEDEVMRKAGSGVSAAESEDYAFNALHYIYNRLKYPDTMQDISVSCGPYDRTGKSSACFNANHEYYGVKVSYKAMNSLGQLVSDTKIFMFDLTTGKDEYDLEAHVERAIEDAWGERKLEWMHCRTEDVMSLKAGGMLTPLPRESVAKIMEEIKNMKH